MLNDAQKAEAMVLLNQASILTIDDLKILEYDKLGCVSLRLGVSSSLRLSAAGSSWLEKRVREVVGPVLHSLQGPILSTDAARIVESAIKAVLRRDRLTIEQYEAYVRGLRAVRWTIPSHPSPDGQVWAGDEVRLPQVSRQDVADFLAQLVTMTETDYVTTRDLMYAAFVESKAAMSILMMPAADFRWLVDQVRTTVGAVAGLGPEEVSARITGALRAVQQIVSRDRMLPQQYDALMARYRAVGLRVPVHSGHER